VQIETELGFSPDWHALEDKKVSAIWYTRQGDFTDQSKWPEIHEWMVTNLEKMDEVFRPRLKKIDPPSENEEDL
jgi:hypothetical protein